MGKKASIDELNSLHNVVAKLIADELKRQHDIVISGDSDDMIEYLPAGIDTKLLAQAITFLKNNNITVDMVESNAMVSLTDSIKKIANNTEVKKRTLTVEDMLAVSGD